MSSAARRAIVPLYALALAVAIGAPLLAPGYLLLRDAVATPRSYLSDEALGLGEAAPRALPQDFAVALASRVVDGGVVVTALLILGLWLAGWGAARLVALVIPDAQTPGELVAATLAIWNPYVAERLLQGHWSLLVGYGALPWVAAATLRMRAGDGSWLPLLMWIALAGLTPTGLLLAVTVALACVAAPGGPGARPRWLCASLIVGVSALAASPWLTASVLGGPLSSPPAGITAFAARAEPGLGTLGSVAALGGIWNAQAVPGSRTTLWAVVGSAVLLAVVAAGLPGLRRCTGWRSALPLLVLAAAAVAGSAALATGPGIAVLESVSRALPGFGLLRDGQKWVALAMPGYALAGAGAVLTLRRWLPSPVIATACCVALIAVLGDLAWGVSGAVRVVRYPPGWAAVAAQIDADPQPVLVLPADSMRRFAWSGPAPVLDPLPRWLRARVLATGDLTISGRTVFGDGSRARGIARALLNGAEPTDLARAGVGWLVVEQGSEGEKGTAATTLASLPVAYRDADIALYRIGGTSAGAPPGRRALMIGMHLVWLAVLVTGAIGSAVAARRRR